MTSKSCTGTVTIVGGVCLWLLALAPANAAVTFSKLLNNTGDDIVVSAVASDEARNTFITGSTRSTTFPKTTAGVVRPAWTPGQCTFVLDPHSGTQARNCSDVFVIKLDPQGNVLFATYFGGTGEDTATAIAVDNAGNIFVAGNTYHEEPANNDFPTTASAAYPFQAGPRQYDAFLFKLNPQGTAVLFSTLIPSAGSSIVSLAVDVSGNPYVAGSVLAAQNRFQATPGAFQSAVSAGHAHSVIVKLNPAGSTFLYATYLGADMDDSIQSLAVDDNGSVYVTGVTSSTTFPITMGVLQSARPAASNTGFLTKLNPAGTALVYSSYLGAGSFDYGVRVRVTTQGEAFVLSHSGNLLKLNAQASAIVYSKTVDNIIAMALDPRGNVYLAATTTDLLKPVTIGASQRCYAGGASDIVLAEYEPAGNLVAGSYYGGAGADLVDDLAVTTLGVVSIVGRSDPGTLALVPFAASLRIADVAQADLPCLMLNAQNGASFEEGAIAPGELVTLRGLGFGPEVAVIAAPDVRGRFDVTLGGVQVLFDGVPAPLIYVQSRQVNVQAPFELAINSMTKIQVSYNGALSNIAAVPVVAAAPAIFQSGASRQGAILNENGSINSESNPARRGSVISVFATGGGATNPVSVTGVVAPGASISLRQPVVAQIAGLTAQIQYAGVAPTLTTGLFQVNLFIPAAAPTGNQLIRLVIGDTTPSYLVTVAIQ